MKMAQNPYKTDHLGPWDKKKKIYLSSIIDISIETKEIPDYDFKIHNKSYINCLANNYPGPF